MRARVLVVMLAACDQGAASAPHQSPPPAPRQPPPPVPLPEYEVIPAQQAPEPPRAPVPADLAQYVRDLGAGTKLFATIETSMGTLTCELYADKAPMTVANFIGLATGQKSWLDPNTGRVETGKPFYDGLTFHRVIPGFMIQGGDPMGNGTGGPGYSFDDEIWNGAYFGPGVLGMANAGSRDSHGTNGSQFFIMEGDRPDLGTRHTVFGKCAPLGVIQGIARAQTDTMDKPHDPISIIRVKISKV